MRQYLSKGQLKQLKLTEKRWGNTEKVELQMRSHSNNLKDWRNTNWREDDTYAQ